jgi:crossover junction endodeoxyribonuclease RuvC
MLAMVEHQGARPGQRLSSTFVSARSFGALLATLQIAGCSIELVTAASWKAAVHLTKDKAVSRDRARLLYPDASLDRKKDHRRAEAIMLAHYALKRMSKAAA